MLSRDRSTRSGFGYGICRGRTGDDRPAGRDVSVFRIGLAGSQLLSGLCQDTKAGTDH